MEVVAYFPSSSRIKHVNTEKKKNMGEKKSSEKLLPI